MRENWKIRREIIPSWRAVAARLPCALAFLFASGADGVLLAAWDFSTDSP
jgi:hypothetical protein